MPPSRPMKGKMGKRKGVLPRLLKMLFAKYKWTLILCMVCLILSAVSNFTASIYVSQLTNALSAYIKDTSYNPWPEISIALISMGAFYVMGIIVSFAWTRLLAILTHKFLNDLRGQLFSHMQTLPIKYFDTHPHGDIMSIYTNDIDTIRQVISNALPSMFSAAVMVVSVLFIMLYRSLILSAIVLFGSIFLFLVAKKIGGKSAKYFMKQQASLGKVEGNIEESIKGLKVIKTFTHEEESANDFELLNNELFENSDIANKNGNIVPPIMGNIGNFLYVLLATVGAIMVIAIDTGSGFHNLGLFGWTPDNEILGYVVSFLMMSRMFTNNINNFSQQLTSVLMGTAGAGRVFDLIDEPSEMDYGYVKLVNIKKHEDGTFGETSEKTRDYAWKHPHTNGTITYTELKGDIELFDVDFCYVPSKLVLEDVSIYAKPGQKIAFVGATGAGKTTITNLINRFYDIADGKIRYDGININKIRKSDLRRSLGIVLQDVNLFTGTVMDNIRYGRLDATDEECINAAKIANAHDFITRLPQGYNTELGADGANLSQGQRQLISIARAAVADAPVMILDEATSSIDTRTEKLVQQGTDQLMTGRTVFVIAHRLSTVQNSDAIMVLDHGHIIERGTHEDLIKQKGMYYQLYTGAFELE